MKSIILNETEFLNLLKKIILEIKLNENYNPDKIYSKKDILMSTKSAPAYIKKYVRNLNEFDCPNGNGRCVKIPQIIYQYLSGNF
jgi:hypothetical protein